MKHLRRNRGVTKREVERTYGSGIEDVVPASIHFANLDASVHRLRRCIEEQEGVLLPEH